MTSLGLDVGGTWLKQVLVDDRNEIVESDRLLIPESDPLAFVSETAAAAVDSSGATSVGVGLAGLVRFPDGEFVWGPHLRGESVDYRSELRAAVGFDVAVDNDANFAVHAEWSIGAGAGADSLVMVTLGTGIGVGYVIGGRVYRGRSFAGEAGHFQMVEGGDPCSCGRSGCWETLVSGTRLDRLAADIARSEPDGRVASQAGEPSGIHLVQAASLGDIRAKEAVSEAGRWLGRGLVNLVLLLDPDRIVVGGAAAGAGEGLIEPARQILAGAMSGSAFRIPPEVVPARFGSLSGAVGAALAGRRVHNGLYDW
ncbi:MAG: ROK family protein [Acidimicrobiia bacterium]